MRTVFLMVFMIFTFTYRYWDVFFKKYGSSGKIYFPWTLYVLAAVHSFIGVSTIVEYFLIKRQYNFLIGLMSFSLFVIGQIVRNLAVNSLKEFHSTHIEIKHNHQLIESGLYKHIRHPYYLGVVLEVLSTPLVLNSYFSFLLSIILYLPALFIRISLEERVLINCFGDRYKRYVNEMGGFLPNLRKKGS